MMEDEEEEQNSPGVQPAMTTGLHDRMQATVTMGRRRRSTWMGPDHSSGPSASEEVCFITEELLRSVSCLSVSHGADAVHDPAVSDRSPPALLVITRPADQ